MSRKFKVYDYDIIYLSYDEPNAEENYYDLKQLVPWAKRVHGVEGSDAAHKACADLAETERFITIDGDNKIHHSFINEILHFKDDVDLSKCVVSWSGYNIINGLTYGNGGIKCWPTEMVKHMKTHENADPNNLKAQVDFCWDLQYLQVDKTYSYVHNNATPQQAWRAGFREGVKMSLIEGLPADPKQFNEQIPKKNLDRLKIWATLGSDVKNGKWAVYGAREGCYKTMCTDWDHVHVRDFEYLNNLWNTEYSKIEEDKLDYEITGLGYTLNNDLDLGIPEDIYDEKQSKFFKSVYVPPQRTPQDFLTTEESSNYDIVMISYNEPNAEKNWENLKQKFPRAKRVHGVKGIPKAHVEAAKLCTTDLIWIVDGDAEIVNDFVFDYVSPEHEKDYVKVWRSINPINGLEYGYGGVKLFPRLATLNMDITKPDMTTSISRHFKPIKVVSNITAFNTDAFSAWKSGFRECCKLASAVIDRQKQDETDHRLDVWCSDADNTIPFSKFAVEGARAGREYGEINKDNIEKLNLINDFDWLEQQFDDAYSKEAILESTIKSEEIVDLLDRFEYMYEGLSDVRRLYNDKDISSVFKIANNEELRKAVVEKNLHSIFRIIGTNDDLRKAVLEHNFYSMARLLPEAADEFRLLQNDKHALWRVLEKYTGSLFVKPLKTLYQEENFDKDCISRGQLKSKKWLVDKLIQCNLDLGVVFLCAGWYATIVPMIQEANIKFNKIRSFDIDQDVWNIAETFNRPLTADDWRFKAQTLDIHDIEYDNFHYSTIKSDGSIEQCKDSANTIINTSCEHIQNFNDWYNKIPQGKLICLQSNNYIAIDEHVNCVSSLEEFAKQTPMSELLYEGELDLEKYKRFMRIGYK